MMKNNSTRAGKRAPQLPTRARRAESGHQARMTEDALGELRRTYSSFYARIAASAV